MTSEEHQKILSRLQLLINMTTERGCTEGEQETAQHRIGAMIQRYKPQISFNGAGAKQEQPKQEQYREGPKREGPTRGGFRSEAFYQGPEVEVVGETAKAIRVSVTRNNDNWQWDLEFWVPRSQLRDECVNWERNDIGVLITSMWFARQRGWM